MTAVSLPTQAAYSDFLTAKAKAAPVYGFEIDPDTLPAFLFPFQRAVVTWALRLGRAALFEDCGLGKTGQELAWGQAVAQHAGGKVIFFAPLAVAQQIVTEGVKFGIPITYVRDQGEANAAATELVVTNYERLERFDLTQFVGAVCDESSILKSYTGKTKQALVEALSVLRFRLLATATPSPNDVMELLNHAVALGVMDSTMALTRWFANDQSQAGVYRLKKHAEADFWLWVASWAVCIGKPSDLGPEYSDAGYELPTLHVHQHVVQVDHSSALDDGALFRMPSLNATGLSRELRATLQDRVAKAVACVAGEPDEPWVIWCNLNDEADALRKAIPGAVEVRGAMTPEQKEAGLLGFARGEFKVLITKPDIAGFGLNYQHCARHAFVGLSYSYEDFYQALRRSYRFGQGREMHAHIITAETEQGVRDTVSRKARGHAEMQEQMIQAMRGAGLDATHDDTRLQVTDGYFATEEGGRFISHHGDCVETTQRFVESNSVGLTVTSIPFSNLYTYSPSLRDMGNTENDSHFFQHMAYLVPELLRVTIPGRKAAMHVQDLVRYKTSSGASGLRDFSGDVIRAMEGYVAPDGSRWVLAGRITIWKSPVTEMQRTKAHRLLYKTLRTDASYTDVGRPDYLLTFRKWTPGLDSADPVKHTPAEFPLDEWQQVASPIWLDIDQQDVLNYQIARDNADEKHICPLQLGVIERCIKLWSNPGDVVFDPFMGIGSTGFQALKMGRKALGVELKEAYWRHGLRNMRAAEVEGQGALFEMTAGAAD